jgi:hypothetical protein
MAALNDSVEWRSTVTVDVRFQLRAGAVVGLLALALTSVPVAAQGIPDEFTNLTVLPEDISRRELIGTMRGFSRALGVRCAHCHTVSDGLDSSSDDFASDEKEAKGTARIMMTMLTSVNDDHLHQLPHEHGDPAAEEHEHEEAAADEHEHEEPAADEHEHEEGVEEHEHEAPAAETALAALPHIEVGCITCHSGRARPATLVVELAWAAEQGGFDALERRYNELREQYFGEGAYNFGPRSLEDVAEALVREDAEAAMAVVDMNLEYHPESVQSWLLKGQINAFEGNTEAAIQAFERSLELAPDNPPAVQALERLRGGGL